MAKVLTDDTHYKNIAQALRDNAMTSKSYKPGEMAAEIYNIPSAHFEEGRRTGYSEGYDKAVSENAEEALLQAELLQELSDTLEGKTGTSGYSQGYTDGQQAEYDRFWDAFQQNGQRTDYAVGFGGTGWTAENFKPKYDIIVGSCFEMFRNNTLAIDLAAHLDSLGVTLDFSQCNGSSIFYNSRFTRLGVMDFSNGGVSTYVFHNCINLKTIDKLVVSNKCTLFTNWFSNCPALENLTIEGTISADGFNVSWSNLLTINSLMSIINALKDYAGSTITHTCTLGTTNLAKLTDAEKAVATQKGWTLT